MSAANFQYANRWSSRYSWGRSGMLPVDGEMIVVPAGQSLLVDLNTPLIKMLLIQGRVVWPLSLSHIICNYIKLNELT